VLARNLDHAKNRDCAGQAGDEATGNGQVHLRREILGRGAATHVESCVPGDRLRILNQAFDSRAGRAP
jgi:hypothetical protein